MRRTLFQLFVSVTLFAVAGGCGKKENSGPVASTTTEDAPAQSCEENPQECTERAIVHLRSNRPNLGPDHAAKLLRAACDSRYLEACTHLGRITVTGWGVSQNTAAGVALLKSSCSGGEPHACQLQAVFESENAERERLYQLARSLWNKQCDDGNRDACGLLGVALLPTVEEPTDQIRQLLSIGCDAGEPAYCGHLANATVPIPATMEEFRSLAPIRKSIQLLEGRCKKNAPVDCAELGGVYGMLGNSKKAYKFSDKACSLGDTPSCLYVATRCSEHGDCQKRYAKFCTAGDDLFVCSACMSNPSLCGVNPDATETTNYLRQACDQGVGDACFRLAESSDDPVAKTELLRRACDHASAQACKKVADGAPPEVATELAQRACLLGEPAGCDEPRL